MQYNTVVWTYLPEERNHWTANEISIWYNMCLIPRTPRYSFSNKQQIKKYFQSNSKHWKYSAITVHMNGLTNIFLKAWKPRGLYNFQSMKQNEAICIHIERQLQYSKEHSTFIQQTKSLVLKLVLQMVTLLLGLRQIVEKPPILFPRLVPHLLCQLLQDRYACFWRFQHVISLLEFGLLWNSK